CVEPTFQAAVRHISGRHGYFGLAFADTGQLTRWKSSYRGVYRDVSTRPARAQQRTYRLQNFPQCKCRPDRIVATAQNDESCTNLFTRGYGGADGGTGYALEIGCRFIDRIDARLNRLKQIQSR